MSQIYSRDDLWYILTTAAHFMNKTNHRTEAWQRGLYAREAIVLGACYQIDIVGTEKRVQRLHGLDNEDYEAAVNGVYAPLFAEFEPRVREALLARTTITEEGLEALFARDTEALLLEFAAGKLRDDS